MFPHQIRMGTGQVYLAFLTESENAGYYLASCTCAMVYDRSNSRYQVADVMDSSIPLEIRKSNVTIRQHILDESTMALVYASYLASWILQQDFDKLPVDEYIREYVARIAPKYQEVNGGCSVYTQALVNFHEGQGNDSEANHFKEILDRERKSFGKSTESTVDNSCEGRVVKVNFGTKPTPQ